MVEKRNIENNNKSKAKWHEEANRKYERQAY